MRPQFPLPRIYLILALSLSCCSLWIPSSDGFKLGGQNFKLDSYTDVVRPATNVSIEFSFSRNFQVLTNKNIFLVFIIISITNRKRKKMLEININARFAPGELMEELDEILDSFPSKLFHPKW